ncbi:MAG: nicotinamide mononucleotide deamidase-related protein [Thermoproteus sp. AZ2]|jgi:molybdenum cofactor synthesis domain-containing protein|uniref:Nicotinamide mononucleotide deamidase-related protein n=1 Tax=Thermoproteus sp. AZ2 TaxID=1609232 RepID=A0ACC6V1G6_9CREN|nr:MAG: damage-inducible protein CinA [Thermoproteus sp. AZ2]
MLAWIISIGNELLIGRVVNTNAAWLAKKLTYLGIKVARIVVVPDDEAEIVGAFREALEKADLVISTGGLGPTPDDITNFAVAKALGVEAVLDETAKRWVEEKYKARGYPSTPERLKMAYIPKGSRPLYNSAGVAPGIWAEAGGKIVVVLPGVPKEMEAIFEEQVEPLLKGRTRLCFAEDSFMLRGVPEADLAPLIRDALRIDERVYVKSHPKGHEVGAPLEEIHIYASAEDCGTAQAIVARAKGFLIDSIRSKFPRAEIS